MQVIVVMLLFVTTQVFANQQVPDGKWMCILTAGEGKWIDLEIKEERLYWDNEYLPEVYSQPNMRVFGNTARVFQISDSKFTSHMKLGEVTIPMKCFKLPPAIKGR